MASSPSPADTTLMESTMVGDVALAAQALESGANPNYTNGHMMCPLLVCCGGSGPIEMLDLLITAGARVDCEDNTGWTALHFAASSGQGVLVARLLAAGAPIDAKTKDRGWTPLTRAAYRSCPHIIKMLLEAGADSTICTEGKTALQWAIETGHPEVVSAFGTVPKAPQSSG